MEITKQGYDLIELAKKAKEKGLNVGEDAAREMYISLRDWLTESALESENKYDDLILAVIPMIDEIVLKTIDTIDGEVG